MMSIVLMSFWDPLSRFLGRGAELVPVLLAVGVVLVAGVLLAWLVDGLVRGLLRTLGFDRLASRPQVADSMRRAGFWQTPSALVGHVLRWLIVVFTASLIGSSR